MKLKIKLKFTLGYFRYVTSLQGLLMVFHKRKTDWIVKSPPFPINPEGIRICYQFKIPTDAVSPHFSTFLIVISGYAMEDFVILDAAYGRMWPHPNLQNATMQHNPTNETFNSTFWANIESNQYFRNVISKKQKNRVFFCRMLGCFRFTLNQNSQKNARNNQISSCMTDMFDQLIFFQHGWWITSRRISGKTSPSSIPMCLG